MLNLQYSAAPCWWTPEVAAFQWCFCSLPDWMELCQRDGFSAGINQGRPTGTSEASPIAPAQGTTHSVVEYFATWVLWSVVKMLQPALISVLPMCRAKGRHSLSSPWSWGIWELDLQAGSCSHSSRWSNFSYFWLWWFRVGPLEEQVCGAVLAWQCLKSLIEGLPIALSSVPLGPNYGSSSAVFV